MDIAQIRTAFAGRRRYCCRCSLLCSLLWYFNLAPFVSSPCSLLLRLADRFVCAGDRVHVPNFCCVHVLFGVVDRLVHTTQIKTVFVGLMYSAIAPTFLVITAIAMLSLYWVDKYSLMRQWKRPPVSSSISPHEFAVNPLSIRVFRRRTVPSTHQRVLHASMR